MEQAGKRMVPMDITSLEKIRKEGILRYGESLLEDCKRLIRDTLPRFTVSYIHLDGDVYRAKLRPCPERYCRIRGSCALEEMSIPSTFFEEEDLPPGDTSLEIHHLAGGVLTLWDFWPLAKDGHVGTHFSVVTHR